MSVPKMHSGGIGAYNRMLQASLYEKISDILGTTGTIIPIFDQIDSSPFQPSSTVPDLDPTFSEAVSAWDTPFNFNDPDCYQGFIPFFTFNGSDEFLTLPDNGYWTQDDSGANARSIGAWIRIPAASATNRSILSKWQVDAAIQEFRWHLNTADKPVLYLRDDSAALNINYVADAAISAGDWHFIVAVYDGTGGASAMGDANSPLYIDGAVVAGTESNNASYVAMEDGTSLLGVGADLNSASVAEQPFLGDIAGGALGPFVTNVELSAAQVAQLYRLGRQALEL